MSWTKRLLGMHNGHFWGEPPAYVDKKKVPGTTPIPPATFTQWVAAIPTVLLLTPNGIWAMISLAVYFLFPYDLAPTSAAAKAPLSRAFFAERLPLWFALTFGYTLLWHVTLYFMAWGKRPFIANRKYNVDKIAHNLFWSCSGIVIWVAFENVFAFLWASGRLAYIDDKTSFGGGVWPFARFIAALWFTPVFRDFHFYFAHRLLHFGPLYAQVHSLHHRNTDIEPFAGLCMHPIEHLYYYACVVPSLVFLCSPFAFLWNGVHLMLAPGASHSGYEDHFQADAYHYFHHRYFSFNFAGANAAWLDSLFGTFKDRLTDGDKEGAKPRDDLKSTLQQVPTAEFTAYLLLSCGCVAAWAWAAVAYATGTLAVTATTATALAVLAGFGPVVVAQAITSMTRSTGGAPNNGFAAMAFQLGVGTLFCSWPVYQACLLALKPAAPQALW